MANSYEALNEKKFVAGNGVKVMRKETLALLESVVETIEELIENNDVGLYVDKQGYLCQRISNDS